MLSPSKIKVRAGTIKKKVSKSKDNSDIFDAPPKFYLPVQLAERDEMVEFEEEDEIRQNKIKEQENISSIIDKLRKQKTVEEHIKAKRLAARQDNYGGKGKTRSG